MHDNKTAKTRKKHNVELCKIESGWTVSWGRGSNRVVLETTNPSIAYAILSYPGGSVDLSHWIQQETRLSNADTQLVSDYLKQANLDSFDLMPDGSVVWDDLGWADAASIFNASYDTRWVHDYRGNPDAMVRDAQGVNFGTTGLKPEPAYALFSEDIIELPKIKDAEKEMTHVLDSRRTHRRFRPKTVNLEDIATVARWTFGRQANDSSRFVTHTYISDAPVVGFFIIDRKYFDDPSILRGFTEERYLISVYDPEEHVLRVISATSEFDSWSDLLWRQAYGSGAGFGLILVSDIRQYQWKYPISRSYNWVFTDAGSFMHTAVVTASGIGLNAFQTPAIDDDRVSILLGIDPKDLLPTYFALFGR